MVNKGKGCGVGTRVMTEEEEAHSVGHVFVMFKKHIFT